MSVRQFFIFAGRAVLFGLLATGSLAASAQGKAEARPVEAQFLLALANQSRAEQNLGRLQWDATLADAALAHCLRMAAEGPIAHQYAGEPDLTARAAAAGAHFSLIEENVAMAPSTSRIHDSWMHSPPHRKNLLAPEIDRVGIAVVASGDTLYAVADYARGVASFDAAQVEARIVEKIVALGLRASATKTAREACAATAGLPSGVAPGFVMRWQSPELSPLPAPLIKQMAGGVYKRAEVGSCPAHDAGKGFTLYRIAVLLF